MSPEARRFCIAKGIALSTRADGFYEPNHKKPHHAAECRMIRRICISSEVNLQFQRAVVAAEDILMDDDIGEAAAEAV